MENSHTFSEMYSSVQDLYISIFTTFFLKNYLS
ncbi:hypothetical protein Mpal_0852 [Methanosphaerula palustris E1-9c]|uniref:Uncharacterized protein n=1 Tax=Methanosphaerula palustris (strain ATCC BAA-1556 / DSM 19958 / E1-9c) TaxID=521011 RepID=B8GGF8_METPE|nr:hypothetical protein Mpal_0852 [Methanosphaerula palustris E1-9c]